MKRISQRSLETRLDPSSPLEWPFPDKRPPFLWRVVFMNLWLPTLFGFGALFLLVVQATNSVDLTFLSSPRVAQGVCAIALLVALGAVPYFLFRRTIDWLRYDLLLHREAHAALRDVARWRRKADTVSVSDRALVESASARLQEALRERSPRRVYASLNELDFALGAPTPVGQRRVVFEYLRTIAIAIVIALSCQAFVLSALEVPSGAMLPTLQWGDHVFVNKIRYGLRLPWTGKRLFMSQLSPRWGEVVVYGRSDQRSSYAIGRIVGLPGDTISVCQGEIRRNGYVLQRYALGGRCEYEDAPDVPFLRTRKQCNAYRERNAAFEYVTLNPVEGVRPSAACAETVVPLSHVYVIGDNRDERAVVDDVSYDRIEGLAWMVFWSAGERTSARTERIFRPVHP